MLKKGLTRLGIIAVSAAMLPMTANAFIVLDPWNLEVNKKIAREIHYHSGYLRSSLGVQTSTYNNQYVNNVVNNYYDGNIVLPPVGPNPIDPPIPSSQVAGYQAMFKSYDAANDPSNGTREQAENSRRVNNSVNGINAAVMKTIDSQSGSLAAESTYNNNLAQGVKDAQKDGGNAAQLQYANAIGLETNRQLIRMRQLMLATEAANNARSQSAASVEAQQLVNSARLTGGTLPAMSTTSSVSW